MIRILEDLQIIKETNATVDKAIEKTYDSIDKELNSLKGDKAIIHGEDNQNNIANTYLLRIEKITKNKKYVHEYLLDTTISEGLEQWLNKINNAGYISALFKIIDKMNELGIIKNIHNEK